MSTQQLWVPGPLPGMNEIIAACKGRGGNGTAYAAMKKKLTNDIALHVRAARLRPITRAYLRFIWREKDKRRDPDNIACARKFILDALVVAKVISNDGWGQIAGWNDAWEVCEPAGVEVALFEAPKT